jgi:hypothetical protein
MFVICCHPPADFPNGFGPYETRKAAREALETAGFTMYQSHQGGYFAKDECEDTIEIVEISPSEKLSQYYGNDDALERRYYYAITDEQRKKISEDQRYFDYTDM